MNSTLAPDRDSHRCTVWGAALALCIGWMLPCALAAEEDSGLVQLLDTRVASATSWSTQALTAKDSWTQVPEDQTQHAFQGDTVLANGTLMVVLRRAGRGAELYSKDRQGIARRAELVPVGSGPAEALTSVRIVENQADGVAVEAGFKAAGEALTLALELKAGQIFVETRPRTGVKALRVDAPCRFAVLPDFFADDMVVDATTLAVSQAELPSENFLLHMVGQGDAIVMPVWHPAHHDVRIALAGEQAAKNITSSEIDFGPDGKVCVAVLSSPGIWHTRQIGSKDAGEILHLNWKAPYLAHWRVDWQRDDQLTDSWEMLTQKTNGEYVKHGWYGQPESFGNVDWLQGGRKRWTTVLGFFSYPCWVDQQGEGYLQPLKGVIHFRGPALVYPINRLEGTPLDEFTVVDVMRATLGIGPCEYILDVEGQKKTFQGRPTCASRTILNDIYSHKQQKQKQPEVEQTLDEVLAFVRHIRARIEEYIAFGHRLVAYLEEQKNQRPELASTLTDLQNVTRRIDEYVARRKNGIKTPEYATQLVEGFRSQLVGYEGDNALARCKKTTAALVDIGGNQDELVGECRMIVKTVRQRAALAMAADPRLAPVANEVRRQTQQMLRNPASYEAPRH